MPAPLNQSALKEACLVLAETVLATAKIRSSDIAESLAKRFETNAMGFEKLLRKYGRDPNIITRCLLYMADIKLVSNHPNELDWFHHTAASLIFLALPLPTITLEGAQFLKDLEAGISHTLADLEG